MPSTTQSDVCKGGYTCLYTLCPISAADSQLKAVHLGSKTGDGGLTAL